MTSFQHTITIYIVSGRRENSKWIMCSRKTGVKCGYLKFCMYNVYFRPDCWRVGKQIWMPACLYVRYNHSYLQVFILHITEKICYAKNKYIRNCSIYHIIIKNVSSFTSQKKICLSVIT